MHEPQTGQDKKQIAPGSRRKSLVETFADKQGVEPEKLLKTLKATVFQQKDGEISNEQMMVMLAVCEQHGLNPFTKEIYAYPDSQKGIVPVVSIDGWMKLMNNHPKFDGLEFEYSNDEVKIDDHHRPCYSYVTCKIFRKDRNHPVTVTEFLDECYREPFTKNKGKSNEFVLKGPWQTHTKRMLRHKATIQCARLAFNFSGIYDEDEAQNISESVMQGESTPVEEVQDKVDELNNLLTEQADEVKDDD